MDKAVDNFDYNIADKMFKVAKSIYPKPKLLTTYIVINNATLL